MGGFSEVFEIELVQDTETNTKTFMCCQRKNEKYSKKQWVCKVEKGKGSSFLNEMKIYERMINVFVNPLFWES